MKFPSAKRVGLGGAGPSGALSWLVNSEHYLLAHFLRFSKGFSTEEQYELKLEKVFRCGRFSNELLVFLFYYYPKSTALNLKIHSFLLKYAASGIRYRKY